MALIPVFKSCSREYLTKEWDLEFPLSEWVSIKLNGDLHEANRYDVQYRDPIMNKTISVYLYMNESSDEVLAIDDVVLDVHDNIQYKLVDTPFNNVLSFIQTL